MMDKDPVAGTSSELPLAVGNDEELRDETSLRRDDSPLRPSADSKPPPLRTRNRGASERTKAAEAFFTSAVAMLRWLFREVLASMTAAAKQFVRLARYALLIWRERVAQSWLTESKLSLGERAWELDIGDGQVRDEVADLKRQLEVESLPWRQRRRLRKQLQRLTLCVADSALAGDSPELAESSEFRSWHAAKQFHVEAASRAAAAKVDLWPKSGAEWCRVTSVAGCTAMVLVISVVALFLSFASITQTTPGDLNDGSQIVAVVPPTNRNPPPDKDVDGQRVPKTTDDQLPAHESNPSGLEAQSEHRGPTVLDVATLEARLSADLESSGAIERIRIRDAIEALKQLGEPESAVGEPKGIADGMLRGIIFGKGSQGLLTIAATHSVLPTPESRRLKESFLELLTGLAKQSHERAADALDRGDNHAFLGYVGMSYAAWHVLSQESQEERDLLQSTRVSVDQRQRYAAEYTTLKRQVAGAFRQSFVEYAGEASQRIDPAP